MSNELQEEKVPYAFFVNDQELRGELGAFLTDNKVSVESVLRIVYQPQALFRVRPVTRCSSSIPGEFLPRRIVQHG